MAFKMKSPYPKRKVTWGTDESGNVVKTITRGKGSDTASRTVTYSQETGKKLGKHREAGFAPSSNVFGALLGGEKTVDFSKGRGLGKTMVTKDVADYGVDPTRKGEDKLWNIVPETSKKATLTRGQMIKRNVGDVAKHAASAALVYPYVGIKAIKNPKEAIKTTAQVAGAVASIPPLLVKHTLQGVQGGIEKVGKKIGSKVKSVATKVRKKRLDKKTK